jgi:tetrahydromethanopterin S-methyltransferase subunit E
MSARVRIAVERILAGATFVFGVVTIFWRDWIEKVFGFDPDHHSGSAEIGIILGLFVISVVFFLVSRIEVRRHRSAVSTTTS